MSKPAASRPSARLEKTPVGVEPTSAGLQPAAAPSGSGVRVSPPGVEPGLRPSQGRVPPPHPEDGQYPDLDSNQGPDLRRVRCVRYTIGTGRAGGGSRTRIVRITGAAPFYVEPH